MLRVIDKNQLCLQLLSTSGLSTVLIVYTEFIHFIIIICNILQTNVFSIIAYSVSLLFSVIVCDIVAFVAYFARFHFVCSVKSVN